MQNIRITIDYRERASKIPDLLIQRGADVTIMALPVGDYIINGQIIIERKTKEDFVQSMFSNHLFEQCFQLKSNCIRSLLIIEGNPYKTKHKINAKAIKGCLLSIMGAWQIPVIFSKNNQNTVELLLTLGKQIIKNNPSVKPLPIYRPKNIRDDRHFFLQGLPSVGPLLSKRLTAHFDSIEAIVNASIKELLKIDGIGKKNAERIKGFLTKNSNQ